MKIKNGSTEIEIEPEDVIKSLTQRCENADWGGSCDCNKCVDGMALNEEGRMLRQLFFKI